MADPAQQMVRAARLLAESRALVEAAERDGWPDGRYVILFTWHPGHERPKPARLKSWLSRPAPEQWGNHETEDARFISGRRTTDGPTLRKDGKIDNFFPPRSPVDPGDTGYARRYYDNACAS